LLSSPTRQRSGSQLQDRFGLRPAYWLPILFAAAAIAGGAFIGQTSAVIGLAAAVAIVMAGAVILSDEATLVLVVATIALLPFGAVPIKVGLSPTFLDLLCLVLLVRWLARRVHPRVPPAPHTPLDLLIWVWLAIALLAFLSASGRAPLSADTMHYFVKVALATLLFFVVIDVVRQRAQLQLVYVTLCVCGACEAVVGLALYALRPSAATRLLTSLGVLHYPTGTDVLRYRVDFNQAERAIATSVDPNVLGGLLAITLVLTLAQLAAKDPILPRRWSALLSLPMLACLALTYSRGAWVSLFIAFVFLGIWRYRRLLLAGMVLLGAFSLLPVSHRFTRQLLSGLQAQDKAAAMRLGEIHDALRLITTYPALGVGFGSSPDRDLYVGVSNIYLLMAEEMGVAGLLVFAAILLIFYVWLLASLHRIQDRPMSDLALGLAAATISVFSAGMLDRYFFSFQHDIALLWLLLGLTAVAVRIGCAPVAASVPTTPQVVTRPAIRVGALRSAGLQRGNGR